MCVCVYVCEVGVEKENHVALAAFYNRNKWLNLLTVSNVCVCVCGPKLHVYSMNANELVFLLMLWFH